MTKARPSKRIAGVALGLGLILIGAISLAGAGRRETSRPARERSPSVAPAREITPGIARAEVDTLDLQLD